MYKNPTTIRLSDTFLLSDMMGCDSIYRRGLPNKISDADDCKIAEGKNLAEALDSIQYDFGPLSVTYGYVSPALSRQIVTYQNPDKPSYHRWDAGAAADIAPHAWLNREILRGKHGKNGNLPVFFAQNVALKHNFSRIITYSESEIVCFGVKKEENSGNFRQAFYENRYISDQKKPKFIKYPTNIDKFESFCDKTRLNKELQGWRGQGYPSYHGGGRKQYEHYRLNDYVLLSDFLYDADRVHSGNSNIPWVFGSNGAGNFEVILSEAASVLDTLIREFDTRFSVVSAFKRCFDPRINWTKSFRMELVMPTYADIHAVAHSAEKINVVDTVNIRNMRSGFKRLLINGRKHEK